MKEYLIVDGYNIIGAWPELAKLRDEEDMAYARDKLIEELNVHAALSGIGNKPTLKLRRRQIKSLV